MRGGWQQPLPDMPAPPPARAWRRLDAPEGYEPQWRRLSEAALELGLAPEQLGETGLDPLAAARGWKPATGALYSKVGRYGGGAGPAGGAPRAARAAGGRAAGAGSAPARPAPAHPDPRRGPRAPAVRRVVRDRAGLA